MAAKKATRAATARAAAKRAEESEGTVRLYLRRTVGRGGKLYGPGFADVPARFAKSLQASGASTEPPDGSEETGDTGGEESKRATKTALRDYGDADALRELARSKGVKVSDDATKAELVDALYDADVSLDE